MEGALALRSHHNFIFQVHQVCFPVSGLEDVLDVYWEYSGGEGRQRQSNSCKLRQHQHEAAYCYSIDYQHVFRIPVEFAEQKPSNKTTENFSPMLNQSICAYIRSIRRRKSSTPIYSGSFSETVNTRLPTNRIKSRLLSSGLRGRLLDGGPSCRVSVALPIAILTQLEDLAAIH